MSKYTSIGGQALIEGIMMRGPQKTAMAVRKPDGSIDISYLNFTQIKEKYKVLGWPVIRGVTAYIESMVQGYKALMKSAEISGFAEDEEELKKPEEERQSFSAGLWAAITVIASVLAVALGVFLFMFVPAKLFNLLNGLLGNTITHLAALFEGIIKLIVLVLYMALIAQMKDIKRVFMYHGAEHKTIFCFEHEKELTVENVRPERRFHPRCGTSFLVVMLLVSMLISSAVAILFPVLRAKLLVWVLIKILMIPLICGVGYEVIKFCGRYDNTFTKIISAPGMWLQRITTAEPDDSMIEIAIAALNEVIPENKEDALW